MRKAGLFLGLLLLFTATVFGSVYSDRAVTAISYVTDPANGMYNEVEGLVWIDSDPTNAAAPAVDNQDPAYLGGYFFSTAPLLAAMNSAGVNVPWADNALERVFINNFNDGDNIDVAGGTEPWWNESSLMSGWLPDSLLMGDVMIPWRFDAGMNLPTDVSEIYLERLLWSMYFVNLSGEVEYSPYVAKVLRGIRNNPNLFNTVTGAIMYNSTDNVYLTALWGLVLESYVRVYESYPVRAREIDPPCLDYDWTEESQAAWLFITNMYEYYFGSMLPSWWSCYLPEVTRAPMDATRGLERWENLPLIMFAAASGNIDSAEVWWAAHVDDVDGDTWVDDVRDYFRTGSIWNSPRGYYEPLHRYPGINGFYELCNLEMYMATLDSPYVNRMDEREDTYWSGLWTGDMWEQPTLRNDLPIYTGIHATVLAHMPNLEITSIESSLPSEGPLPYDYSANITQDHVVTVYVTNKGLVAVDSLELQFLELYTSGVRIGSILSPRIEPGETIPVNYDIGGPGLPGDHTIMCDLVDYPVDCYDIVDSDLLINVQDPARIDMIATIGDPVTAPSSPLITRDSEFNIEIQIDNTGGAAIRELELDIAQSSPYGLAFDIPGGTHFSGMVNIPGGTTGLVHIPVVAPTGVGSDAGDDIYVEVTLVRASDENDRTDLAPGEITITDDDEYFDIQNPTDLSILGLTTTTGWVNATDPEVVTVHLINAPGDVAAADSLDVYEQSLELVASIVTGIAGLDAPSFVDATIGPGTTGDVEFTLTNDGGSENAIVDVNYTGHFHDANRGDMVEAEDSPILHTFAGGLGIDLVFPDVQPLAPSAGNPWPADDTIRVEGIDNLSGVDFIEVYVKDEVGGQYWNFATGAWQAGYYGVNLNYDAGSGQWEEYLPNHPGGTVVMYMDAADVAGNDMPTRQFPIGSAEYGDIVEVFADLWRAIPVAPIDSTAIVGHEYECDWNWVYRCSVHVANANGFDLNDVEVTLYSIQPLTVIVPLSGTQDVPSMSSVWFVFQVTAPGHSCVDSLYAYITDGTDDPTGHLIGQRITDNDFRVLVEKPADLEIVETWVEPTDINNWSDDTAFVTKGQDFHYHAIIRNNGEDSIDSLKVFPAQTPGMGSLITPGGFHRFTNFGEAAVETLTFDVTASNTNSGPNPEQFDQMLQLMWHGGAFTANNHEPGYSTGLVTVTDNEAPIGIQEGPELVTDGFEAEDDPAPVDIYWINRTNTIKIDLWLRNILASAAGAPKDDRAAADRFLASLSYDADLHLWNPGFTTGATGIDGLRALGIDPTIIDPDNEGEMTWELSWDGTAPAVEGPLTVVDYVDYGDENYQAQMYANESPHCDTFPDYIGLDITRPTCEIVWPRDSMYADYPETVEVLVEDLVSGIIPESVNVQFENPEGLTWDGTVWNSDDNWFTAHYDITYGADTFWYDIGTPTVEGCYTYRAYAYDVAGNKSLVDEVHFIWDITAPESEVRLPIPGYYSYDACHLWDRVIEVWALDDTMAGFSCVSHVKNVYVAIHDTILDKWWDPAYPGPGNWRTSATAYWLPCTPTGDPEIWEYTGFTDDGCGVLQVYSYARDTAGNFLGSEDTMEFVIIDDEEPNSVLRDQAGVEMENIKVFNVDEWWAIMGNKVWGDATDYFTRVDSIRYSIYDSLGDAYWNGTVFVPGPEIWLEPDQYNYNGGGWFTPDSPPHAPGEAMDLNDLLAWRADFVPPDFGVYRIRSKAYDDLCHEETTIDTQNTKVVMFDNCQPVIHPRYPEAGGVYYIGDWTDSIVVFAYDSCGWPLSDVDSVNFWIYNSVGEYYGYLGFPFGTGWDWYAFPVSIQAQRMPGPAGDSLWYFYHPAFITAEGHYTIFARAYDSAGNIGLNAWGWTITVTGGYLTVENFKWDPAVTNDDPYFVDDTFTCRVIAWHHPGVADTNFAHELYFGNTMPDPLDFEIVTPGPYWAFRGTLEVECIAHEPVLGMEVYVDAPTSGLARASTEPIDIIANIDDMIGGFVMDNPNDQGDALWIRHNRTTQDPAYGGIDIDTSSIKITEYRYYRDMDMSATPGDTNWQQILVYDGSASDGDSVRILFDNMGTFNIYEYSMIVKIRMQALGDSLFTGRIMLPMTTDTSLSPAPRDNIEPDSIVDLAIGVVGGEIRLDWGEVLVGIDGSPEINPAANVTYDIYRYTDPYDTSPTALVTNWPDPWYSDPGGIGDITTPYYYMVKAKDSGNNYSPSFSNSVGEVDYQIEPGWNGVGYPLPRTGVDMADEYTTELGAVLDPVYSYKNDGATAGWSARLVGPFVQAVVPGEEAMMAYSTGFSGIATWTGDVPEYGTISYDLHNTGGNGWNGIMIPLDRDDLTMASDLYYELDGLGLNPVTVARRIPGGGWDDIVAVGGTVYFDFPLYPGHVYLVWVENDGTWRDPVRSRKSKDAAIDSKVLDVMEMPSSMAIPVVSEDKADFESVEATALFNGEEIPCDYDNGLIRIELSDFEEIHLGDQITIEVDANHGAYIGSTTRLVTEGPISVESVLTLEKTGPAVPEEFALHGNYPNPFNPTTSIKFDIPEDCKCDLSIYNINGRRIANVISGDIEAGYHNVVWDGRDDSGSALPGGIYYYVLRAGDFKAQRRMMLVK